MIYRSFLEKRTKSMGRCDTPHTPNAAQVWNAASATNRGNLKPHSFHSFARQISSRFSQVSFHLLRPGNLLALRRLRDCYSGKVFPRTPFCLQNPNLPNKHKQKARLYFTAWLKLFYNICIIVNRYLLTYYFLHFSTNTLNSSR